MTSHSEIGQLDKVMIVSVRQSFKDQQLIDDQWERLRYSFVPSFEEACAESKEFTHVLRSSGATVYEISKPFDSLDGIYCRDASIMTDFGAIICRMGKESRRSEPVMHKEFYRQQNIPILAEIKSPGLLEGGDVAWIDETTLAVGLGYRTNLSGIKQLAQLLKPFGIKIIRVDLPHFKGPDDVFHLMSIFSPVDSKLAVIHSPLMPVAFRNYLLEKGFHFVEVPLKEFKTMACNVLALGPRDCLVIEGNPETKSSLEEAGCRVREYRGRSLSLAGEGGPTCLTRPLMRQKVGW